MTSSARTLANRRNSRKSTGPKSVSGKARSSKNALRHGLETPPSANPVFAQQIEDMARALAGEGADLDCLRCARRVAEAQYDVLRIRRIRDKLLNDPNERLAPVSVVQFAQAWLEYCRAEIAVIKDYTPETVFRWVNAGQKSQLFGAVGQGYLPEGYSPLSMEQGLPTLAPKLMRLERYERRAFSRRNTAMRELAALKRRSENSSA